MNQHRFLLLHDISPSRPQSYTLNSKGGSVSLTLTQRETVIYEAALREYIANWPIDLADPIIYNEPHEQYRG